MACIGLGHLSYGAFNWLYDQILYVFVVYRLGLLLGGGLMTLGSLLQCAALLLTYQRLKIDWVGASAIHSVTTKEKPSTVERILSYALRKGELPIFVTMCIFQDPFITTAYFKKGRFDVLTRKDWLLFFASVLVSNGYWTLRSGFLARLVEYLGKHLWAGI